MAHIESHQSSHRALESQAFSCHPDNPRGPVQESAVPFSDSCIVVLLCVFLSLGAGRVFRFAFDDEFSPLSYRRPIARSASMSLLRPPLAMSILNYRICSTQR
jgi:hypothetical protein